MKKYSYKCTCGHVMTLDAMSKEDAFEKFKAMMSPDAIKLHYEDKHPGQPLPTSEEFANNLENGIVEGEIMY